MLHLIAGSLSTICAASTVPVSYRSRTTPLQLTLSLSHQPKVTALSTVVSSTSSSALDDSQINLAMTILKNMHPEIKGLQSTCLGIYNERRTMPRFQSTPGKFVQIMYLPGHWIVATNVFSSTSHEIYWYDSLPKSFVREEGLVQLSSLLRYDGEEQMITIKLRKCHRQSNNTELCGYFAIAFAVAICSGLDPTGLRFDEHELVKYVQRSLNKRFFDNTFPIHEVGGVQDVAVLYELKRHCICHRACHYTDMVKCIVCGNSYHANCVSISYDVCPPIIWKGPCCPEPLQHAVRYAPDAQCEETVIAEDDGCIQRTSSPCNDSTTNRHHLSTDLSPIKALK